MDVITRRRSHCIAIFEHDDATDDFTLLAFVPVTILTCRVRNFTCTLFISQAIVGTARLAAIFCYRSCGIIIRIHVEELLASNFLARGKDGITTLVDIADFFVIQRFISACGRLRFIFAFAIFAELICATSFCFCASLCICSSDAFAFATNGLVGGAVNRFVALLRRVSARRLCFAFELVIGAFLARLTFTTICAFCFIFARIGVGWCFGDAFASRANGALHLAVLSTIRNMKKLI